jgi:uncharacterized membrane protein
MCNANKPALASLDVSTGLPLSILLMLFAAATVLPLFPDKVPLTVIVAAHIIPAALFALIHGALVYRLRGILVFTAISLVVGNVVENIGVLTGFPFGHYYFTAGMGPKLFLVPILMGPAYVGMGYVSWTLGCLMVAGPRGSTTKWGPGSGLRVVTVPLAASFAMVAWNLTMDPALSTVGHYWIWKQGGAYFGVPVTNFLGWFFTNYIIYQLFALYLRRRASSLAAHPLPALHWYSVLFYALMAAGAVLRAIPASGPAVVADATGAHWKVSDINGACALAAVFIMGPFVLLAWARLAERD